MLAHKDLLLRVFCRRSTYKVSMCFDHCLPFHADLIIPVLRGFERAPFTCGANSARPASYRNVIRIVQKK